MSGARRALTRSAPDASAKADALSRIAARLSSVGSKLDRATDSMVTADMADLSLLPRQPIAGPAKASKRACSLAPEEGLSSAAMPPLYAHLQAALDEARAGSRLRAL